MRNELLQQKLGELIYELGEINFNAITKEFWQKHINESQPFTEKQIESINHWITETAEELKEIAEKEANVENQSNIDKAIQILKDVGLKELEVCRFGIYRQYEVAGERVSVYVMEEGTDEEEEKIGDRWEELYELLQFIDEDYIYDVLGFDDEGQNTLILTHDGFKEGSFRI
jgi:hypothetical protein